MAEIQVIKRDGSKEPIQLDKLHKMVAEACKGISDVSESEIEINSKISFYDGITTTDITNTLIKSAANLITEDTPNYQHVAARLINFQLRKDVYKSHHIPTLWEHLNKGIEAGYYDPKYLEVYSKEEIEKINKFVWHERDFDLVYCAMEQFRGKYLVKNRVTEEIYETPQMAYILIAMMLFHRYPKETRLKYVKDYYDAISLHYISLPTPIMAGMRTNIKQFSSCVLIDVGDSIESLTASNTAVVKYVSKKAGIGLNFGRLRAVKSPIRNGDAYHTGVVPYMKLFQASVGSCNQGGVRKGAATVYFPIWHLEIEDVIVLKNEKGTEFNRARHLDYSIQINKLFYERYIKNGNVTLFSPKDVPGLYEAFFADQDKFKTLYEAAEKDPTIRKKVVTARDLFNSLMNERKDTGRIYIMNVDHVNTHSSFYDTIYQSNLCCEITLPTTPIDADENEEGLIALCTLSAINWGKIKQPEDFEKYCNLAVRALDELLDIQDYPMKAAAKHTQMYRPLGIGVINYAYFLAKHNLKWGTPEALELTDKFMESMSYYLIKASNDLAKEKCFISQSTPAGLIYDNGTLIRNAVKYNDGIVPRDTRKKEVDEIFPDVERLDWDGLRASLKEFGIRNATLMALMPSETSSQISNSTNGIEPPRGFVSDKGSKDGVFGQVVPELKKLKNKYELLWDMKSAEPYLKTMALFQKYVDQTISTNTSYNPEFFEERKIPMSLLMKDLLNCYKWGIKTLYYANFYDGQKELDVDKMIENDGNLEYNTQVEEEDCSSCKI